MTNKIIVTLLMVALWPLTILAILWVVGSVLLSRGTYETEDTQD